MLPTIFGENLFDDFMDDAFERNFFGGRNPLYGKHSKNLMKLMLKKPKQVMNLILTCQASKKMKSALIWKTVILPFRLLKALIRTKKITKAVISAVNVTAAA